MKTIHYLFRLILLIVLVQSSFAQSGRRMVAEWEPVWGTLIRWPLGIPEDLVVELATDDSLYVLVESNYQRDQALATFGAWGVNLSNCRFLYAPTYSHWTRDWGPHYVFNEMGIASIADPVFDGYPWVPGCNQKDNQLHENKYRTGKFGYEEDDAVNPILADSFNCPVISLPIYLTGGNIMVDGHGTAVSTHQMLDENIPLANEDTFREMAEDSLGIDNYIIVDNPEEYGIQHIDCYAKFLDEETIMVKQVDDWHPEYACCEDLANKLSTESNCWGDPYHIIRIYCGSYNGTEVAAYTNSLILNKKVLVPQFDINSDETALQTYEEAMPGYEVIGFEWNAWYYYDALHCRTMGIFDRHMLRIVHKPVKGDISVAGQLQIVALIDDRSEAGLAEDELKLHWRTAGSAIWNDMIMMPVPATVDSFYSYIPDPEVGETYEYYVSASDQSGRFVTCPRTAPDNHIAFTVTDISTSTDRPKPHEILSVKPSVFSNKTHIHYAGLGAANISLYSIQGEKIREWQTTGETTILWQGDDEQGKSCAGGLYIIKLADMFQEDYLKCILVR